MAGETRCIRIAKKAYHRVVAPLSSIPRLGFHSFPRSFVLALLNREGGEGSRREGEGERRLLMLHCAIEAEAESDTKGIEIEGENERRKGLERLKKLEYDFASRERDRRRP